MITTAVILVIAGTVAGALNVVAGGGSFLTIPILIFLGLPPTVANGTNRVAIFLQNVTAVWGFQRHGVLDWRYVLWAALPATVGAGIGAIVAVRVGDETFRTALAGIMIVVTLWTLWDPLKKSGNGKTTEDRSPRPIPLVQARGTETRQTGQAGQNRAPTGSSDAALDPGTSSGHVALGIGFFFVGIYGGFVQAGVGFLILAATTLAGLDLVRGNAVKVLAILIYTALAVAIFAWQDKINWPLGLALAAGNMIGSQIGVRLTVKKGHRWIKGVVTGAVIIMAVKLLFMG